MESNKWRSGREGWLIWVGMARAACQEFFGRGADSLEKSGGQIFDGSNVRSVTGARPGPKHFRIRSESGLQRPVSNPFRTRFAPVSHPFRTRFASGDPFRTRFAPVSHPIRKWRPVSHPFRTRFAPTSGSVSHPIRDLSRQRVWSRVIWGTGPLSFCGGRGGGGIPARRRSWVRLELRWALVGPRGQPTCCTFSFSAACTRKLETRTVVVGVPADLLDGQVKIRVDMNDCLKWWGDAVSTFCTTFSTET